MKTEGYEEEGGLGVGAPGRNAAAVPGMGGRDGEAVAAPAATAGTAMEGGRAVAATAADGGEDDGDQDDEDGLSPEGDGGGAMGRKKKRRLCEDRRFGEIGGRRGRLLGFIHSYMVHSPLLETPRSFCPPVFIVPTLNSYPGSHPQGIYDQRRYGPGGAEIAGSGAAAGGGGGGRRHRGER